MGKQLPIDGKADSGGTGADECRTQPVLCTLLFYVLIHWICDSDSSNLYKWNSGPQVKCFMPLPAGGHLNSETRDLDGFWDEGQYKI